MRTTFVVLSTVAAIAGGCAQSSTIPLAQDTFQITASAAPVCGVAGAQNVAVKQAAAETIRRGYDRFIVQGAEYQNTVRVVGHTPVVAQTYGTGTVSGFGNMASINTNATTTFSGGQPVYGGSHNQGLIVRMFREGDPMGANAVSARETLGPQWQELAAKPALTCL